MSYKHYLENLPCSELIKIIQTLSQDKVNLLTEVAELKDKAYIDYLTGAYTRRMGEELLLKKERELSRSKSFDSWLLFIDVDNFKMINDDQGHLAGDDILKSLGMFLRHNFRSGDVVIRWGGDEFIILINDCPNIDNLINRLTMFPEILKQYDCNISLTMGLTRFVTPVSLTIKRADILMYAGKAKGRGCLLFRGDDGLIQTSKLF